MVKNQYFEAKILEEKLKSLNTHYIQYTTLLQQRQTLDHLIEQAQKQSHVHADLNEQKKQVRELKKNQQSLDILLDEFEDFASQDPETLKNSLWNQLLALYPLEQQREQKIRLESYKTAHTLQHQLQEIKYTFSCLHHLFQTLIAIRQSIKGVGFLQYVFGTSPNLKIEALLQEAYKTTQRLRLLVVQCKDNWENANFLIFATHLDTCLIEIETKCQSRWGFSLIDSYFAKLIKTTEEYQQQIDEYEQRINASKQAIEKEIENGFQLIHEG